MSRRTIGLILFALAGLFVVIAAVTVLGDAVFAGLVLLVIAVLFAIGGYVFSGRPRVDR
jgi:hypothetical protein